MAPIISCSVTINNLTYNTVNNPAPPQLAKVLTCFVAILQWGCKISLFPVHFSSVLPALPHSSRREQAPMAHSFPCKALVLSIWAEAAERWGDTGFEQRTCATNGNVLRGFHTNNSCDVCHRVGGYGWQHLKLVCIICLRYALNLSQLLSKVTTVTGLKKRGEGREVQVLFGCFPQGYWALS